MTRFTGTQYEGKARKELQEWNIFAVGLQPDASPDLILPQFHIGLEIKSTRMAKFYPSKNAAQYEYLKNQFSIDWPEHKPYYMIYFIKTHAWKLFDIRSKSPFKANEGMGLKDFISDIISSSKINFKNIKYKNEVINNE